ncbi:MAG: BBP7 family outer membrane beta-barrel protein [Fuerstiella sp.]
MFRPNLFRSLTAMCLVLTSYRYVHAQHPNGYWQMPGIHVPQSQPQSSPPIVDYYGGQRPKLWDNQQPVEQFMGELAKRSWIRVDYLHWTLGRPGSMPIGAPLLNITDPLVVFDNMAGTPAGEAIIPSTGNLALDDSSGIRGTWGLDLASADLELEFFGTEQNSDGFSLTNLSTGRATGAETIGTTALPNVVTPLLSSGGVADAAGANYLIYDSSFETNIKSQIWGAEATLLSKPYLPGEGLAWQWLGGFRYVAYEEEFRNRGVNNSGGLGTDVVTTFGGETLNNMYGPEVGARLSAVHRWFTFSATPRIAFALNDYTAEAQSAPLGTTEVRYSGSDIEFTPIVQISFTGEIHITPNFSVFGGYDFMWIYRMTRPYDNIVYDSAAGLAGGFVPDIRQEVDLESFYARGLSVGCVLRY